MVTTPTTVTGDASQALALLAWTVEHGVAVACVVVGAVRIELARAVPLQRDDDAPRPDRAQIYKQFGGDMMAKAIERGDVDENGLQTVVGRR